MIFYLLIFVKDHGDISRARLRCIGFPWQEWEQGKAGCTIKGQEESKAKETAWYHLMRNEFPCLAQWLEEARVSVGKQRDVSLCSTCQADAAFHCQMVPQTGDSHFQPGIGPLAWISCATAFRDSCCYMEAGTVSVSPGQLLKKKHNTNYHCFLKEIVNSHDCQILNIWKKLSVKYSKLNCISGQVQVIRIVKSKAMTHRGGKSLKAW